MLRSIIASGETGDTILQWIDTAALVIEVLAVIVIIGAILYALARYAIHSTFRPDIEDSYSQLKAHLGRALLLGLEILVAADIVRTVALDSTLQAVAVLGLLVLIRTFLSWALVVEIDGRWPWQPRREEVVAVPPVPDD